MTEEVAHPLKQFDTDELIAELRTRNLVLSIWNKDDFSPVILEDEDCADLTEEEVDQAADAALHEMKRNLEDHLGSKGNEFIADMWYADVRDTVMDALRKGAPAP